MTPNHASRLDLKLSLREAGEFDAKNGLKDKLTGWGVVSKDRHDRKVSRKARRTK
jgi:hypothetical protein